MKKSRLDLLLVEKNLIPSREKARTAIMCGSVYVNGIKKNKPGELVDIDSDISIKVSNPYVGRGGLKLYHALEEFNISVQGKTILDVGASTGGFVDCLLQNGAARVIALDVGYGQLAWSLRNDTRVKVMEKTNVKYITKKELPEDIEMATVDVSFISLHKVFPVLEMLAIDDLIVLIKPQFEAGKEKVGKKGVIKDPAVHLEVLEYVIHNSGKYVLQQLTFAPIKGPKGNIEFLAYLRKDGPSRDISLSQVVKKAHTAL